jgi:hypothetical protein
VLQLADNFLDQHFWSGRTGRDADFLFTH